jgi:hypothetical protein
LWTAPRCGQPTPFALLPCGKQIQGPTRIRGACPSRHRGAGVRPLTSTGAPRPLRRAVSPVSASGAGDGWAVPGSASRREAEQRGWVGVPGAWAGWLSPSDQASRSREVGPHEWRTPGCSSAAFSIAVWGFRHGLLLLWTRFPCVGTPASWRSDVGPGPRPERLPLGSPPGTSWPLIGLPLPLRLRPPICPSG